jgi:hypothetical protein
MENPPHIKLMVLVTYPVGSLFFYFRLISLCGYTFFWKILRKCEKPTLQLDFMFWCFFCFRRRRCLEPFQIEFVVIPATYQVYNTVSCLADGKVTSGFGAVQSRSKAPSIGGFALVVVSVVCNQTDLRPGLSAVVRKRTEEPSHLSFLSRCISDHYRRFSVGKAAKQ